MFDSQNALTTLSFQATPATPANIPADPDVIVIDDEDEDVEPDAPPLKKSRMSIEEMPKNSQVPPPLIIRNQESVCYEDRLKMT